MKRNIIMAIVMAAAVILGCASINAKVTKKKIKAKVNTEKKISDPLDSIRQLGTIVDITTSEGPIQVLLYNDTPGHRDNFIKLAKDGTYEGTLFHRVIKDFMVQAGDPDSKNATPGQHLGSGDLGYTQPAEIDFPRHWHKYGALAAARTGDQVNPERRSSASQFYIVTGQKYSPEQAKAMAQRSVNNAMQTYFNQLAAQHNDSIQKLIAAQDKDGLEALRQQLIKETEEHVQTTIPEQLAQDYTTIGGTPNLDGQYTVFGEVIKGMDVVEKIQNAATDSADRPKDDIEIISVKVEE